MAVVAPYRGAVTTRTWLAEPAPAKAGSGSAVLGDAVAGGELELVVPACPAAGGLLEPQAARMSTARSATAARPHGTPTTQYFTKW